MTPKADGSYRALFAAPGAAAFCAAGFVARLPIAMVGIGIPEYFARSFAFIEHDGVSAIEVGDVRLEPTPTIHFVPTWGFRVTARPASGDGAGTIGYSADSSPTPNLDVLAEKADLFICEAALRSLADDAPPPERRDPLAWGGASSASRARAAGPTRIARPLCSRGTV